MRLFVLLIFTIILNTAYAQEHSDKEHLLFFGVPVDGSIESFRHNLTWSDKFERRADKDEKDQFAFAGEIFGEWFWVWAYYDTKREINDNLVYQVVISKWFDTKEQATSYMAKYLNGLKGIYGDLISDIKQTDTSLDIEMNNGCVNMILKDKGEGKWSMVSRFLDYKNDRRVNKVFDYYGTPAIGCDGTYDIDPSKLKIHGR